MLICRYVNFIQFIKKSPKCAVQYLYQKVKDNLNTVTGRNAQYVVETTGARNIEDIKTDQIKKNLKFCEKWKAELLEK